MRRLKRQFLAIALCVLMAFGLLPANMNAFAAEGPAQQIGSYFAAEDATGALSDQPNLDEGNTAKSYAGGFVQTYKTIRPGTAENEFLITLNILTKEEIGTIQFSEDAAVVLVIDLSNSMAGGRLGSAKVAAQKFVNSFAQTEGESAVRKVAVVGFSGEKSGYRMPDGSRGEPIAQQDGAAPEDGDVQTATGGMVHAMPPLRGPAAADWTRLKTMRVPDNAVETAEGPNGADDTEPDGAEEETTPGATGPADAADGEASGGERPGTEGELSESEDGGERPDDPGEGQTGETGMTAGEGAEPQDTDVTGPDVEPQSGQEGDKTVAPGPAAPVEEDGGESDAVPTADENAGEDGPDVEPPAEEEELDLKALEEAPGATAAKTYKGWTDVTADASSINAAIGSMSANGGTCLQAGLILARNLLDSGEVSGISNKNIIVLTDGNPTYYLTASGAASTSTLAVGQPSDIRGTGSSTDHNTHTETAKTAMSIRNSGVNLYGVYLGSERVVCKGTGLFGGGSCGLNTSGAAWLSGYCGMTTYAVENADGLSGVFEKISELIKQQATAWLATDPLGGMFTFDGFEKEAASENEYFYDSAEKTIQWNLRLSSPVDKTEDGFSIYSLTYRVKLNTLAPGFQAGTYYPTNGVTSVTYLLERAGQSGVSELENGTAYFNIPSAKGYAADIVFRKTDDKGRPLPGASFEMYTGDVLIGTARSGEDGAVTFEAVPSGHAYTIIESEAPEGFIGSSEEYRVDISYGEVHGSVGGNNVVVNVPQIDYGALTVSKTVSGTGASTEDGFAFTVTLDNESITGVHGDMVFENGVAAFTLKADEQATASGLPPGTAYTVTEDETEGYTATVNGESKTTEEGTITAGTTAVAAFDNFYNGGRIDPDPQYGGLIVSKTISGEGADPNDAFTFTVTLGDRDISGVRDQMEFVNGVAVFKLRGGESATASGLDAGMEYTVTEAESEGYTVTANGERRSSVSGTIVAGEINEAVFDNYRGGQSAPSTTELRIEKTVEATGDVIPAWSSSFSFVVSTSLKEDDIVAAPAVDIAGVGTESVSTTIDLSNLPQILYVWERAGHEEDDGDGWTYDKTVFRVTFTQDADSGEMVRKYERLIRSDDDPLYEEVGELRFTNTYYDTSTPFLQTGNLEITKTVSRGDRAKAFAFTVTLDEGSINGKFGDMEFVDGVAEVYLRHGESVTAEGLPAGVGYAVEEVGGEGYTVTVNGESRTKAEGAIIAEHTVTETFQNELADAGTATPSPSQSPAPPTLPPGQSPSPGATKTPSGDVPMTGDNSHTGFWGTVAILCATSAAVIIRRRKLFFSRRR